jgi:hypothetical protein
MFLELLRLGGFFAHFDLAGQNLRPGADIPWWKIS